MADDQGEPLDLSRGFRVTCPACGSVVGVGYPSVCRCGATELHGSTIVFRARLVDWAASRLTEPPNG